MSSFRATLRFRRLVAQALVSLTWLGASLPHALATGPATPDALSRCSAELHNVARSQGASLLRSPQRAFLLAGDQRSFEITLPGEGCMHVVAIGQRNIQDVDLAVFDPSGRKLADDRGAGANPYASFCGAAARRVVAHVVMMDGDGEVELSTFWNGPRRLRGLDQVAATCDSSGSPRPPALDVGPEPPAPSLEEGLVHVARELAALGYHEAEPMTFGGLNEQHRESRRLMLPADRCFALVAIGGTSVADIDLRVFAPYGSEQAVGSDVTRRRHAIVKLCTEQGGNYLLDVRMFRGGGTYVVKTFELDERVDRPAGLRGTARIEFEELAREVARRGMVPRAVGWSLVRPERPERTALRFEAGRCYALFAVGSDELPGRALELSLLDESGGVTAVAHGMPGPALLFHCAEASATYRAVAYASGVRSAGRYLLIVGESGAMSETAR